MKLYMRTTGNRHAQCSLCGTDFGISNDVTSYLKTKKHCNSQMAKASTSTSAITTLFQRPPQRYLSIAEVRWATFIAKHNYVKRPC